VLPPWAWAGGLAATSVVAAAALVPLGGASAGEAALAVAASLPIALVAVRCLGETDLNPVSGLGKLTQAVFGALYPHSLVANVLAGAVAEAGAQQAGDLMQDLKVGALLGVPLRAQFAGQVIGSLASVFAAVAAFRLFDAAYGVPSATLPAPTAALWVSMAEVMSGRAGALPVAVAPFAAAGAAGAAAVALATSAAAPRALRDFARQWAPSPTAFSIGVYIAPNWTIPRVAGALAGALLVRRGARPHAVVMAATGLVLGEGCAALAMAVAAAAGARPASCFGCAKSLCGNFCA